MHKALLLRKCYNFFTSATNKNIYWIRENCKLFGTSFAFSNSVTGQGLSSRGSRKGNNAGEFIENKYVILLMFQKHFNY